MRTTPGVNCLIADHNCILCHFLRVFVNLIAFLFCILLSGPNHEYLFGIADALRSMGQTDSEIFFLEEMVLSIMAARKTANQMLEDASDASVVDITEM